jgi:hypothetical protein
MSSVTETQTSQDAIDVIMQRLSVVLLQKQSVSFERLRRLTLLGSSRKNSGEYCEIIVLSLIKHLELDKAFNEEIKDHKQSYRLFNALNLNDDKINSFFVEFIAVIAPDIFTALSAVLAQLVLRLAEKNSSRHTKERMQRLQQGINNMIEDNKIEANEEEESYEDEPVVKSIQETEVKVKQKQRKLSISEWMLGPGAYQKKTRTASSKTGSSKGKEAETVLVGKRKKDRDSLRLGVDKLSIHNEDSYNSETASDTTRRLATQRRRERKHVPDVDFDPIPTRDSIKDKKEGAIFEDDGSSIVF